MLKAGHFFAFKLDRSVLRRSTAPKMNSASSLSISLRVCSTVGGL
jgi:hypothetical protein